MKILRLTPNDLDPELQTTLHSHSLYSSPSFARIWRALGGRDVYWVGREGSVVTVALSGVEFGRGPLARFQAMPDGLPTHLLAVNDDVTAVPALCDAIRGHGYSKIFINDYHNTFTDMDAFESIDNTSWLVDVLDPEWQPPDAKLRSEIRKAEREGVIVETFEAGRDMAGFMSLVEVTDAVHDSTTRYDKAFFSVMAECATDDARIVWNIVRHKGQAAASHIYFVDGDTMLYWQSFFDRAHSSLKPNQYMLYQAAKEASRSGVRFLNLGQSPPGADSLKTFKEKWGGAPKTHRTYTARSLLGRIR